MAYILYDCFGGCHIIINVSLDSDINQDTNIKYSTDKTFGLNLYEIKFEFDLMEFVHITRKKKGLNHNYFILQG